MNIQNLTNVDLKKELSEGISFHQKGNLIEAESKYKKIISINPNHFDSLHLLGVLESQKGNYDKAIKLIKESLNLNSKSAIAWHNLSLVCQSLKLTKDAYKYCENALSINPKYLEALSNKSKILIKLNKAEQAKAFLLKLIKSYPNYAEFFFNLAVIFKEESKLDESVKFYKKAIEIRPDYALAYFNLANIYLLNNDNHSAKNCYEYCLKYNYEKSEVYNNLGKVYENFRDFQNAEAYYKTAIDINKNEKKALHNLINIQLIMSNWSNIHSYLKLYKDKNSFDEHGLPINFNAIFDDPELHKICNETFLSYDSLNHTNHVLRGKNSKIKIGYFSADFSDNNPVTYLIKDLIKYHDRSKFEIYGFSLKNLKFKDETRKYYENHFDRFFDLELLNDYKIKKLCDDLSLDIAIDLNGYTKYSRPTIFSHKLAHIQINFLGYPGTLGSNNYDYIVADKIVIPNSLKKFYTENIIFLPDSYFVNPENRPISKRSFKKEDLSISQSSFVYCCFNQNYKILPNVFNSWMNILKNVDQSILLLSHTNDIAKLNLKKEASKRNVDPNRIVFASYLKNIGDHLARYKVADLFLDTMPYNAHTTASDSIWAGVPLITCIGKSFASRVSSSILSSVGLDDLITKTMEDYEKKAIEIGNSYEQILELKNRISNKRNLTIFDCKKYTNNLELSFEKIYEIFLLGNKPHDIHI
tara:strand:+ start:546 stop:2639 length:2094 start_codon:yes stop_codon:yes gene_type:complete